MKMTLPPRLRPAVLYLALMTIAGLSIMGCDPKEQAGEGFMLVFDYQGKFIPVEQLHKADADACDAEHWHASGQVITLRSEVLTEPDPACGFGRDGEIPVREVPMPDDYIGVQRTDEDYRFDPRD